DRSLTQTLSLPKGYYTLQAAVEAVRQDQPSLEVSGVSLCIDDTAVGCHTADGAPEFFSVGEQLEEGEHTIGLYVSGTNANWVAIDNVVLRYYGLHRPLAGDINNDGYVTITDVTMLVDNILDPTNHPIETCLSDLNGDDLITVADVTYLVDIILAE
ncbi:MAG: dockerin type I repeat-containing protein, partial [Prevotella sp.]|nr:dockerin type I repeat-containing protein [Prevotella sp.]